VNLSILFTVTSILLWSAPGWAQGTAQTNDTSCESQKSKLQDQVNRYEKQLRDWPNLGRYRDEDARMTPPKAGVNRVVFMGDSITDFWGRQRGTFFPGKPYVNRGISGQTTPQMLIRFRPDVVNLQPKVVVILAGTNDIAGNTGPESLADIENNLMSMAEIAKANKIRVVLATVMPVCDYIKPQTGRRPPAQIKALNTWIRQYAGHNGLTLLDYYSAMVDDHGMLKKDLTFDGLHPNAEGYGVMGPLAEKAVSEAESRSQQ
jgi:lysophospholipase L1-like esterase